MCVHSEGQTGTVNKTRLKTCCGIWLRLHCLWVCSFKSSSVSLQSWFKKKTPVSVRSVVQVILSKAVTSRSAGLVFRPHLLSCDTTAESPDAARSCSVCTQPAEEDSVCNRATEYDCGPCSTYAWPVCDAVLTPLYCPRSKCKSGIISCGQISLSRTEVAWHPPWLSLCGIG